MSVVPSIRLFDHSYFRRGNVSPDLGVYIVIVANRCGYCTEAGVLLLLLLLLLDVRYRRAESAFNVRLETTSREENGCAFMLRFFVCFQRTNEYSGNVKRTIYFSFCRWHDRVSKLTHLVPTWRLASPAGISLFHFDNLDRIASRGSDR